MSAAAETKKRKIKDEEESSEEDEEFVEGEEDSSEEEEEDTAIPIERNDDGEAFFKLSEKRRVTVRKWKKQIFVDFREFYEKDGKALPGKKGISLSIEQFEALGSIMGQIKKEVKALSG